MQAKTRLVLICHAATEATRRARFPADEPLDDHGLADAQAAAGTVGSVDRALTAPATRCRQTASALGLDATVEVRLREVDCGRWAGRSLAEVETAEPDGVLSWLTDPAAAPHGGESVVELVERVGGWLDGLEATERIVVVTHAAVIRAAIVHAIRATPESFWRIDVAPLDQTVLNGQNGRWTLRLGGHRVRQGHAG